MNDTTVNTLRRDRVGARELAAKEILDIGPLIAEKARARARAQALLKSALVKIDNDVVDRKGKVVGRAG